MTPVQMILVPQGAEYQAVCRGLRGLTQVPDVQAIPVGTAAVTRHLTKLHTTGHLESPTTVLVLGLCGSLTPAHRVGDRVLYQGCWRSTVEDSPVLSVPCDRALTDHLSQQLSPTVPQVPAITCDRLVVAAMEKQQLARQFGVTVVDMEGYAILQSLSPLGVSVAMLRVVSDDSQSDLPDLSAAIGPEGSLKLLPLAWGMVRQPIAASRLIRGSLRALKTLERTTAELFNRSNQ